MEFKYWKNISSLDNLPCPHCLHGKLVPLPNSFISNKTKESVELEIEYRGQYPWTEYYFAGILKCNICKEIVTTCGEWAEDRQGIDIIEDVETGVIGLSDPEKYYKPKYFHPNLQIFKIPENTPVNVMSCLNKSFALFWSDISGAINKIRIAIEYLLDERKIDRIKIVKTGKKGRKPHRREVRLSLEQRINLFKIKNKEIGSYLLNIKEIGNKATHTIEIEDRDLLLKVYETIEYVLISMYNKPEEITTSKDK